MENHWLKKVKFNLHPVQEKVIFALDPASALQHPAR
jgi:hypothetical protein